MKISPITNYQPQNRNNKKQNLNFGMFYGPHNTKTIQVIQLIRPLSKSFLEVLGSVESILTKEHFLELAGKSITDKGIIYLDRQDHCPIIYYLLKKEEEKLYTHLKGCVNSEPTEIITLENLKKELEIKGHIWLLNDFGVEI